MTTTDSSSQFPPLPFERALPLESGNKKQETPPLSPSPPPVELPFLFPEKPDPNAPIDFSVLSIEQDWKPETEKTQTVSNPFFDIDKFSLLPTQEERVTELALSTLSLDELMDNMPSFDELLHFDLPALDNMFIDKGDLEIDLDLIGDLLSFEIGLENDTHVCLGVIDQELTKGGKNFGVLTWTPEGQMDFASGEELNLKTGEEKRESFERGVPYYIKDGHVTILPNERWLKSEYDKEELVPFFSKAFTILQGHYGSEAVQSMRLGIIRGTYMDEWKKIIFYLVFMKRAQEPMIVDSKASKNKIVDNQWKLKFKKIFDTRKTEVSDEEILDNKMNKDSLSIKIIERINKLVNLKRLHRKRKEEKKLEMFDEKMGKVLFDENKKTERKKFYKNKKGKY